jgi:hypothetical protein
MTITSFEMLLRLGSLLLTVASIFGAASVRTTACLAATLAVTATAPENSARTAFTSVEPLDIIRSFGLTF